MLRGKEEARCGRALLMVVRKGPQHPAGSWERSQKGGGRKGAAVVAAEGAGEEGQEEEDGASTVGATAASPAPARPKIHFHASSVSLCRSISPPFLWILGRGHVEARQAGCGVWGVGGVGG